MRALIMGVTLFACSALAACSQETKEQLGLSRTPPDEFAVVTRAPLSVPPDYHLRPPSPGADRPMEISTRDTARQTVFGVDDVDQSGVASSGVTPSEGFMDRIGATSSNPDIRQVVDAETAQNADANQPTAEKLMFWRDDDKNAGTPIDPAEEMQRLEEEGIVTIRKRNEDIEAP